jgi:hypothetical protein
MADAARSVRLARAAGLAALAVLAARVAVADSPKSPLDLDRALVARVAAVLPPGDRPASAWLEALKPSSPEEDRDVGGGARRVEVAVFGESTSIWVHALLRADRVVEVSVRANVGAWRSDEEAFSTLRAAMGKLAVTPTADGFRHAWSDPARRKAHRDAIEKELGARGDVAVPDALRPAFELLDGALSPLHYGTACYEDGAPPPGREALEALVKARCVTLLRALLRSPSPEGRVYAVEGLRRLRAVGAPDPDAGVVALLRASPVLVASCRGCIVSDDSSAVAVDRATSPTRD